MTTSTTITSTSQSRRRRRMRAYVPIALLAAVQGLYIAATPSVSVRQSELGQLGVANEAGPEASGANASGDTALGQGPEGQSGSTPSGAAAVPSAASERTSAAAGGASSGVAAGNAEGDTSHCTPGAFTPSGKSGRQHDKYTFVQEAPVCAPRWPAGADNGGATYKGVTADAVKIVIMEELPNEQVNAILNAQNLAMTEADIQRIFKYGSAFLNKYYEHYGRKLEFVRYKSKCPVTPPDVVTCKEEARKVIAMQPFAVIWAQSVYPEVFDEFARAGIVSFGGWNFADSYFTARRPFRYDVFMTGTKAADHLVEYYCKKMANKPTSNSGRIIHPTIGDRSTPRKLGIIVNEQAPLAESARYIAKKVSECEGRRYVPEVVTFVGDIDRGAETQEAVTSKMINSKTTTVLCWCGPLEMTGFTKSFTGQQYYPEHLLPGIGFSDGDVFARLYDPAQWVHAFGPSHIADSRSTTEYQSYAAYKDAGDESHATIAALLYYLYLDLAAQAVQYAGPDLTPLTLERGLLSSPGTGGGEPKSILWDWGPNDYGGYADVREIWYDPTLESEFDGKRGGYRVLNNHHRYRLGEWPASFNVPPAAQ